jgi:hypothetical protein
VVDRRRSIGCQKQCHELGVPGSVRLCFFHFYWSNKNWPRMGCSFFSLSRGAFGFPFFNDSRVCHSPITMGFVALCRRDFPVCFAFARSRQRIWAIFVLFCVICLWCHGQLCGF